MKQLLASFLRSFGVVLSLAFCLVTGSQSLVAAEASTFSEAISNAELFSGFFNYYYDPSDGSTPLNWWQAFLKDDK